MYRAITITKGSAGWGGPLMIIPTDKKNKVVSVTGGVYTQLLKKLQK